MMSRSGNCNQFIYSSLLTLHVSDDLVVGMWAPSADPRVCAGYYISLICFFWGVFLYLQYSTLQYSTLQYSTVHYITVQYITLHYCKMLHYPREYFTILALSLHYTSNVFSDRSTALIYRRRSLNCGGSQL